MCPEPYQAVFADDHALAVDELGAPPWHGAADAITKPSCHLRSGGARWKLRALQQYKRVTYFRMCGAIVSRIKIPRRVRVLWCWVLKLPPQDAEPPLGCVCSTVKVGLHRAGLRF